MQFVLGILAPELASSTDFSELVATTGILQEQLGSVASGVTVLLGAVARRFSSWLQEDTASSVHLDGDILAIDGHPTTGGGRTDAELLAVSRLFEAHGSDAWARLDGSFFLVVRRGTSIHAGVDLAGTRGVYWWEHDGEVAFHSRLLDVASTYPGEIREDWGAIAGYLATGVYPPGRTAIENLHHLGAGQHLTITPAGVREGRHFRLVFDNPQRSAQDLVDELIDRVEAAVALRLGVAESPVVPLSGGVDSRYLAAELVRQAGPESIPTITWGEEPERPNSDARVAAEVAAALGVRNTWRPKVQIHTPETFERALYLTSGESDGAIHYPSDSEFHHRLVDEMGFRSLFRGDECFGYERLLTDRAVAILSGVGRLSPTGSYARVFAPDLLEVMSRESQAVVDQALGGLSSRTSTGRRDELWYEFGVRRLLAPYNSLKHQELEIHTPFLDRRLLEWLRNVPDGLRAEKRLVREAMARRFPKVAAMPYATRDNMPAWEARSRDNPAHAEFLREWFSAPGWLDEIDARRPVLETVASLRGDGQASAGDPANLRRRLRRIMGRTAPSRVALELALARRADRNDIPVYLRLGRLAVLHGLLGRARRRHRTDAGSAPDAVRI
jgi:asparagine synthetase B (glutamine-hydrolysing)